MKLPELRFDNPNNACLSLRILAEKVRTGEISAVTFPNTGGALLRISIMEPTRRDRRRQAEP